MKLGRGVSFVLLTLATALPCSGDQSVTEAGNTLRNTFQNFDWQPTTAISIDIDADGTSDIAVLGYTEKTAAVGVVLGAPSNPSKTKLLDFIRGGNAQRGMCGRTAKLVAERQSNAPLEALGELPSGYKICDKCFEVAVDDDMCDPIYIYWNHDLKDLGWWRP